MSAELSELIALAKYLKVLDNEITVCEAHLSQLKRDRQAFSREHIPDLMADLAVKEFTLDDGARVKMVQKVFANISEARSEAAFKWLRENGQDAIIKTELRRVFGAGLEEKVDRAVLEKFLKEKEIDYSVTEGVHAQTLKAFVRTQIEKDNKDFPTETFGVFITDETVVES